MKIPPEIEQEMAFDYLQMAKEDYQKSPTRENHANLILCAEALLFVLKKTTQNTPEKDSFKEEETSF